MLKWPNWFYIDHDKILKIPDISTFMQQSHWADSWAVALEIVHFFLSSTSSKAEYNTPNTHLCTLHFGNVSIVL